MGPGTKQVNSGADAATDGLSLMRWVLVLLAAMGVLVVLTWASLPGG